MINRSIKCCLIYLINNILAEPFVNYLGESNVNSLIEFHADDNSLEYKYNSLDRFSEEPTTFKEPFYLTLKDVSPFYLFLFLTSIIVYLIIKSHVKTMYIREREP